MGQLEDRDNQTRKARVNRNGSLDVNHGNFSVRIDEVGDITYIGEAHPGTLTSASEWRIKKVDNDESITYADGNDDFNNIWDNRLAYAYS